MKQILTTLLIVFLGATCFTNSSYAADVGVPAGSQVLFKNLTDGQTVSSPVQVEMGVEGLKVAPAGNVVAGEGHHHLIIDGGPTATMAVIGADETHLHFGKGQTEASVPLSPGKHTLTLQFADGAHRSYGPALSKTISVNVK